MNTQMLTSFEECNDKHLNECAVKIQSIFRGYSTRKSIFKLSHSNETDYISVPHKAKIKQKNKINISSLRVGDVCELAGFYKNIKQYLNV